MNTRKQAIAFLLLAFTLPVTAGQAYTWTDARGVTHFSESAPSDQAQDSDTVELQSAPVIPGPPPERFREISTQAARLQADRIKREQLRAKRRQVAAQERQAYLEAIETERREQPEIYLYYPVPYRHHKHPGRHHPPRPHRPRHSPQREWFQPGKTITQQRNADALREHHWYW